MLTFLIRERQEMKTAEVTQKAGDKDQALEALEDSKKGNCDGEILLPCGASEDQTSGVEVDYAICTRRGAGKRTCEEVVLCERRFLLLLSSSKSSSSQT